jgi:hypothetical protein
MPNVYRGFTGPPRTPATARQLGAALIAAAVEAEEMAGYDRITVSLLTTPGAGVGPSSFGVAGRAVR